MRSSKSRLFGGKLPLNVLKPILKSMPRGRLVKSINRIGMDAAIIRASGNYVTFSSGVVRGGKKKNRASDLILKLTSEMRATGAEPMILDPVILFPQGVGVSYAKSVISEITVAATKENLTIGKGHTEITPWLDKLTIIVTLIGISKERLQN